MTDNLIPILPDLGDASPCIRLAEHLFPGHKRLAMSHTARALDTGAWHEVTEVYTALAVEGLEGDWSKVPGFAEEAETQAAAYKRAGQKAPPYAPEWPDLMGSAHQSAALGARLSVVRRLDDEAIVAAAERCRRLLGLSEDEEGN